MSISTSSASAYGFTDTGISRVTPVYINRSDVGHESCVEALALKLVLDGAPSISAELTNAQVLIMHKLRELTDSDYNAQVTRTCAL